MKPAHSLFKFAALFSSALLVAGCVSYRSGVFDWFKKSEETGKGPADSKSSASEQIQKEPTFMSGTKSPSPSRFIEGITPATKP